jgi:hypothetical protein
VESSSDGESGFVFRDVDEVDSVIDIVPLFIITSSGHNIIINTSPKFGRVRI